MAPDKTNMALDKTKKASIIIHGFAAAAAALSATTAFLPFIGPLAGDTIGLTAITIAMTVSLANLFEKEFDEGALWAFGSVVAGMIFGVGLAKGFASLIPGGGSAINATITFTLHEAIGWGLFLLFERGGDLPTTRAELERLRQEGSTRAEKERQVREQMMSKLPPEARKEVERLEKKIADKNLSIEDKQAISDKILAIFEKYNSEFPNDGVAVYSEEIQTKKLDKNELRMILVQAFDREELRILCSALGISFNEISDGSISEKADYIIRFCEDKDILDQLIDYVQKTRPTWIREG